MKAVIFNKYTGKINRVVMGPTSIAWMQHNEHENFLIASDDDDIDDEIHYVDPKDESVHELDPLDLSYSRQGLEVVFTNLPSGCVVRHRGHQVVVDDDPTVIEFDKPGTYRLKFRPDPPFRDDAMDVKVGD